MELVTVSKFPLSSVRCWDESSTRADCLAMDYVQPLSQRLRAATVPKFTCRHCPQVYVKPLSPSLRAATVPKFTCSHCPQVYPHQKPSSDQQGSLTFKRHRCKSSLILPPKIRIQPLTLPGQRQPDCLITQPVWDLGCVNWDRVCVGSGFRRCVIEIFSVNW
jgi:hypothetical protein